MSEATPQDQPELFGNFSSGPRRPERIPSISKSHKPIFISTTLEQILLIVVLSLLTMCLVFFLGVLRGKSIASAPLSQPARTTSSSDYSVQQRVAAPAVKPAPPKSPVVEIAPKQTAYAKDALKPYTIQLSTTKKKSQAESEVDVLRKAGYYTMIIPSGNYYQVCVGFYSGKAEAKKDLAFFKNKYRDCFLRRR